MVLREMAALFLAREFASSIFQGGERSVGDFVSIQGNSRKTGGNRFLNLRSFPEKRVGIVSSIQEKSALKNAFFFAHRCKCTQEPHGISPGSTEPHPGSTEPQPPWRWRNGGSAGIERNLRINKVLSPRFQELTKARPSLLGTPIEG